MQELSLVGKYKSPRLIKGAGERQEKQEGKGGGEGNRGSGMGTQQEGVERPSKVTKC